MAVLHPLSSHFSFQLSAFCFTLPPMPTQRHFLGWDRPVAEAVRDYLIPGTITESVNLGETLIIVPTRQAGRCLRETLAAHCAASNAAMLSARVVVPSSLFRPVERADYRETSGLLTQAVWAEVLQNAAPSDFTTLFPPARAKFPDEAGPPTVDEHSPQSTVHSPPPPSRDFTWAQSAGQTLQQLREALADGGHTIQSVLDEHGEDLEELDRWKDLAEAEKRYLARVEALTCKDATLRKIEQASAPELPEGVTRVVVASVPDPSLLMIRALEALQKTLPVDILVMAPEKHKELFDTWGRPIPDAWRSRPIDIPDADATVILTGTPKAQADRTIQAIAESADRFGPGDVAIGVPDRAVIPFLETALTELGLPVFDPAEKFLRDHPLYGLLDAIVSLYTTRTYAALHDVLRHPDVMAYLRAMDIPTADALTALDEFQNDYLPIRLDDVMRHLPPEETPLRTALLEIRGFLKRFDADTPSTAIRVLLQTLFAKRMISSKNVDDAVFAAAAEKVSEVLTEFAECRDGVARLGTAAALRLLMQRLTEQTYHAEREDSRIDLEGWLELPWNDAPFLIATGMNEGRVPDGRLSDVFLPDTLRRRLGLRSDAGRLARDAYLMTLIIETRRTAGKTLFLVGKTSAAGDPLKPSRLLFRCPESELATRAAALFAAVEEHEPHHASTISFALDPVAPLGGNSPAHALQKLSVTAFRSYLACPFRFYLQRVLRMNALDDSKRELDALDFGSMLHAALQKMGESGMWQQDNALALADFLIADVEDTVTRRFPHPAPLPVQIALDAARQRLRQAAEAQVAITREGWELIRTETLYEMTLDGMTLRGTIDRVDRHRKTGALRIIDYKTSDKTASPLDAHIGSCRDETPPFAQVDIEGKTKRWVDLQLPLYQLLLQTNGVEAADSQLAYFNLPKAVLQTGLSIWEGWNPALSTAAHRCAQTVVQQIQDGIFWPPAPRVDYDDFALLFPAAPEACFTPIRRTGSPRTEIRDRREES